jgi:hypothetical protein
LPIYYLWCFSVILYWGTKTISYLWYLAYPNLPGDLWCVQHPTIEKATAGAHHNTWFNLMVCLSASHFSEVVWQSYACMFLRENTFITIKVVKHLLHPWAVSGLRAILATNGEMSERGAFWCCLSEKGWGEWQIFK